MRVIRATVRIIRWLTSLAVLAAFLAGTPYLLFRFTGTPLPRSAPSWRALQSFLVSPLTDSAIIRVLADAVWLLWIIFALSVIIEAAALVLGRSAPRIPGIAPVQALAAAIVGATIITFFSSVQTRSLAPPLAAQPIATATPSPGPVGGTATNEPVLSVNTTAVTRPREAAPQAQHRPRIHRVTEGETLWGISTLHVPDPGNEQEIYRYSNEIYQLNVGKPQPDGEKLENPDLIKPGWVLLLPAQPGGHAQAAGHRHPPAHSPAARRSESPETPTNPSPGRAASPTPRPSPQHKTAVQSKQGGQNPAPRHDGAVDLPSGTIIAGSLAAAIALAVAAGRMYRRRWRRPEPVPGTAPADPPPGPALRQVLQTRQPGLEDNPCELEPNGLPRRTGPSGETVPAAIRDDGTNVDLDLARAPGTGITGSGADAAVRALAVSLLARRTSHQDQVMFCGARAREALSPDGDVPGLSQLPPDDALGQLEAEILHRRRLLDAADIDTLDDYRVTDPDEPLPTIVAIADPGETDSARLTAVLELGQPLGVTAILLGTWPTGANIEVADDARVTQASEHLSELEGARMYQLAPSESSEVLAALAAADGGDQPQDEPETPPRPLAATPPESDRDGGPDRAAELSVLGVFQLLAGSEVIAKGMRRKAAELLTYLAVHPDGATTPVLLDTLWPDTSPERAGPLLHAATTNVRSLLRTATGTPEAPFIVRVGDHLRIDTHVIGCDLWRFRSALAGAAEAPDDASRRATLESAVALWRGDLADGMDPLWIEEHRETLRRDAVDALALIATLSENDEPEHALAVLERAITIDRYQEALYQRIMTIQAALGRKDAARRTYQLLETRLVDLEVEPDESTASLLTQILNGEHPGNPSTKIILPNGSIRFPRPR